MICAATAPGPLNDNARGETKDADDDIVFIDYLIIEPMGKAGRTPIHTDALLARIVAGEVIAPKTGDAIALPDGSKKAWQAAKAKADGTLEHAAFRGGYAFATITREQAGTMLLDARGHSLVYVNGALRAGNPYGYDYMRLPVPLRAGANTFLFQVARGSLNARLRPVRPQPMLSAADHTLPDILTASKSGGGDFNLWCAAPVINPTATPVDVSLVAEGDGLRPTPSAAIRVPAEGVRKVPFRVVGKTPSATGHLEATLRLTVRAREKMTDSDTLPIRLAVVTPSEVHRRTFISQIDGSVQYYAVNPCANAGNSGDAAKRDALKQAPAPALILSLHGASVEAVDQARAYSPKTWGHLIAPTNRRPFGFDWEEWGRMDAIEVLDRAAAEYGTDPNRVYLTGHSMGGHGTWHLGVTFSDRFAALGPSASWISFFSYGGGERPKDPGAVVELLSRASNPSDTLALLRNTRPQGVYILHGDADDNVPVSEARTMREKLGAFHRDVNWHEQPGAGHWWENSAEPGAECVDWPAMFDLFARRRLPSNAEVREIEFATFNPGISARHFWATIYTQRDMLQLSSIQLRCDPLSRRISGTTTNVQRLMLNLSHLKPEGPLAVELDAKKLEKIAWPAGGILWLERSDETWTVGQAPPAMEKGPQRHGPFKEAFRNRFVLVYGTKGTAEENAWSQNKARYDAETFWYRGNGSVDVVPDSEFDASAESDRGVIVYGNADTHAAWPALLAKSPVQVRRGRVEIGKRKIEGADLACLFIQPRPGSDQACVAVVSGTGPAGSRFTERLPYFLSGAAFPDCAVISAEALARGMTGVRAAGYFGNDWRVESGAFSFSK